MDYSARKVQFDRAFHDFIDAHGRGMRSLSVGDFRGLQDAVADESVAVEKISAIIGEALSLPGSLSTVDPRRVGNSDESVRVRHARLIDQMRLLEREHRDLETRPADRDAHREHRARLDAHIAELRLHLKRLRARAGGSAPDPGEK